MMRFVIFIHFLILPVFFYGQKGKATFLPINDDWFNKYGSKGLQVGDKMPDLLLGNTINNTTGKKRISDFRGKLVILDFWDTRCTSCMEAFPKMEALQKKFGDRIQILLVNTTETKEEITRRLLNEKYLKSFKLPNLPTIVSNRSYSGSSDYLEHPQPFAKLFPTYGVPHHVWIDGKGAIVLRGGGENTYAEKIENLLSGKSIYSLNNTSTVPSLSRDKKTPYYRLLGGLQSTPVSYGSFITPFCNEIEGAYGTANSFIDSASQIRVTYFINWDLLKIYKDCFSRRSGWGNQIWLKQKLYTPVQTADLDFVEFPSNIDTLKFIGNNRIFKRTLSTEEFIRGKYCYEQMVPWNIPEDDQGEFMVEDLNRYFAIHYGIIAAVEKRKIPYYSLHRTSKEDKFSAINDSKQTFTDTIVAQLGMIHHVYHSYLGYFFSADQLGRIEPLNDFMIRNKIEGKASILINETGWLSDKRIVIDLPSKGITTVEDLRKVLKPYDLDITEGEREVDFIVFKKCN